MPMFLSLGRNKMGHQEIWQEAWNAYGVQSPVLGASRFGDGHINDTFCICCQSGRYILQAISGTAFPHPEQVMENMVKITRYLSRQLEQMGEDPKRQTLQVLQTKTESDFYRDTAGKVWRLMPFVEGSETVQDVTPEIFAESGRAFGRFQYMLRDYPAETLYETIPHFHDTERRFAQFQRAVEKDAVGRVKEAEAEIRLVQQRKQDCSVLMDALRQGKLPLRVTHNDTKINNVLFDVETGKSLCVVDLDTTMPGLAVNDFGDSIRFGANHCAEDEPDLSKVTFDQSLYEIYLRGFLEGTCGSLTEQEIRYLPWGARLMTLECGMRFLTDFLEGDVYFHTAYPQHNLVRCRTQLKLVQDMEACFPELEALSRQSL